MIVSSWFPFPSVESPNIFFSGNLGYGKLGVGSALGGFGKMAGIGSSHGGFAPEGELFVPLDGTPRFPVTETDPGDLEASVNGGRPQRGGEEQEAGEVGFGVGWGRDALMDPRSKTLTRTLTRRFRTWWLKSLSYGHLKDFQKLIF